MSDYRGDIPCTYLREQGAGGSKSAHWMVTITFLARRMNRNRDRFVSAWRRRRSQQRTLNHT